MLVGPPGLQMLSKRMMLLATISLALVCPSRATENGQNEQAKQADAICASKVHPGEPGMAVLVKKNGRVLLGKGYGLRRVGSLESISADTNFRLASFTKQFTAMAVMLLIQDGKLQLGTTLAETFPEFPDYGKTITVRHLLTHTSGLPDYEMLMEQEEKAHGPRWSPEHQIQDEEVLTLLEKVYKGKFAPGTSWAYSNSGYVVLGLIVAKVSGVSYGEFLQQRIFAPFVRLHGVEDYPGLGLGLSATKRVVEIIGGQIGVTSTPGNGSTFFIELMAGGA